MFTGLLFANGYLWQEQRRFSLRHLRDLGFGKSELENQMMSEIDELLSDMEVTAQSDPNRVIDFNGIFTVSVINIFWLIVAGTRYDRDDPKLKQLLANLDTVKQGNPGRLVIPFPDFLVNYFPRFKQIIGVNTDVYLPLQAFIQVLISLLFPVNQS